MSRAAVAAFALIAIMIAVCLGAITFAVSALDGNVWAWVGIVAVVLPGCAAVFAVGAFASRTSAQGDHPEHEDDVCPMTPVGAHLLTRDEWDEAVQVALDELGCTYDQLADMAARADFDTWEHRRAWLMFKRLDDPEVRIRRPEGEQ